MRVKQGEQATLKVTRSFAWFAKAVLAMSLLALLLALGCSDSSSGSGGGGGGDSAETCAAGCAGDQCTQLSTVAPATLKKYKVCNARIKAASRLWKRRKALVKQLANSIVCWSGPFTVLSDSQERSLRTD